MRRFRLSGHAASELDIRAQVADDLDSAGISALLASWDGQAVTVDPMTVGLVCDGINELSNHCDELSRCAEISAYERLSNRWTSQALATLLFKVHRYNNPKNTESADGNPS